MNVKHIGLVCRREKDANRFYGEFLKLVKSDRKAIPASITLPLFGLESGVDAYNYTGRGVQFEIFILDRPRTADRVEHVCLAVPALDALVARAASLDIAVIKVKRGDAWLTFIEDYDGHRFELKQAAE